MFSPVRVVGGLLVAGAVATWLIVTPAEASTVAKTAQGTEVGISSAQPWSAQGNPTLSQLQRRANTGQITLSMVGQVAPATATPSGYSLVHPGYRRGDYIYDSDNVYQDDVSCSATCTLKAETRVQEHQYVVGTTSKYWRLQENAAQSQNPGGLTWRYTAVYYCGVNISGGADHICGNGADASGGDAPMTAGENVYKRFEQVNNNTVFPMVGISTHFSTGVVVTTKFRGWDTLNRASTTKLNSTSGNGG